MENSSGNKKKCQRKIVLSPSLKLQNYAFSLSNDGRVLAAGCDKKLNLYNTFSFSVLQSFLFSGEVEVIELSPNGKYVSVVSSGPEKSLFLQVFDIVQSELYMNFTRDNSLYVGKIGKLVWSPGSKYLLFGWNRNVCCSIYRLSDKKEFTLQEIKMNALQQLLCCFSQDEEYFIAVLRELPSSALLYATDEWICLKKFCFEDIQDIYGVSWLPDSASFYLWESPVKFNIQIWSIHGKLKHKFTSSLVEFGVDNIAHSPCGRLIAVKQLDKMDAVIYDSLTGIVVATLPHNDVITTCKWLVVIEEMDSEVERSTSDLYSWKMYEPRKPSMDDMFSNIATETVNYDLNLKCCIGFSSCGQYMASYERSTPGVIWIWNLSSHLLLDTLIKFNVKEGSFTSVDIQWHPSKMFLAVNLGCHLVLWNQDSNHVWVITCQTQVPLVTHWCNTQKPLIVLSSRDSACLAFEINKKQGVPQLGASNLMSPTFSAE